MTWLYPAAVWLLVWGYPLVLITLELVGTVGPTRPQDMAGPSGYFGPAGLTN
jgi:hypothetical protein